MIPGGEDIVAFNRTAEKPRVIAVADCEELHRRILADIQSLRADGYESIATICKTADESAAAHASLSASVPLRLITRFSPAFEREALVIPAYLANAVILYDGSHQRYHRENERNLFYTACTRAMHLLHIYTLGEPSPFIRNVRPDTYLHESTPIE